MILCLLGIADRQDQNQWKIRVELFEGWTLLEPDMKIAEPRCIYSPMLHFYFPMLNFYSRMLNPPNFEVHQCYLCIAKLETNGRPFKA